MPERRAGAVRGRRGAGDPRRGGGGGAADRPLPRDHRDPPLRRPRLAGAGARRPRGRSPTTPAATASPTRPRRARVMDTRSWSATWSAVVADAGGRGPLRPRRPLDGRPHRGRLRAAPPRAARRPGRDRPDLHGRRSPPSRSRTGTGSPRRSRQGGVDGFVDYIDREQGIDPAWRDSVLRFTRERMLRHRHLEALADALREVPRSRPFEALDELERLDVPALVVASHDAADPGHPYAVAAAYAERLPRARLISEAEGESPLAWQGGRLSREIAAFCARGSYLASAMKASGRSARCGGSSPSSRPSASASPPTSRSPTPAAARRSASPAATAARRSPKAPTRTCSASTSRSSASSATSLLLAAALLRGDGAAHGRLRRRPGRLRLQPLPDLPGAVHDRRDLPVVRRQRGADDAALRCSTPRACSATRDDQRRVPSGLTGDDREDR